MSREDALLEEDLMTVLNQHINENNLHPMTAALTMLKLSSEALEYLTWQPQYVQQGVRHIEAARECIKDGD